MPRTAAMRAHVVGRRLPESLLAEIRARTPLPALVGRHVAKLRRAGARQWSACCPFHQEKTPSFAVYDDHFHCFGCGAHGDAITFVQRVEGIGFMDAVRRLAAGAGVAIPNAGEAGPAPAPWSRRGEGANTDGAANANAPDPRIPRAWEAWRRSEPIRAGDPAAQYLAGRGLWPLPNPARQVLRLGRARHPETGEALHPVLLARVDGPDGQFRAVHRTYLAPRAGGGWGKLGVEGAAKRAYGPVRRGAVRLVPAAERLGLAEGIETALAAHALTGVPVWACVAAPFLEAVELPFDVGAVTVFADRDEPKRGAAEGRGLQAARVLERRLVAQAVRVEIRVPLPPHEDYADVWAAMQHEGGVAA